MRQDSRSAGIAEPGRPPDLSVVVPVFNEAENLELLYEALCSALEPGPRGWELILVDDGSSDGSLEVARGLAARDRRVTVVSFRRNFGQTAALAAGFAYAAGEVIVTLDADLQNDPADIPMLMEKLEEGWDLVNGWRRDRKDPYLSRLLPSRLANRLIAIITGIPLHDSGCTLKALRREIAQELRLYGEMHRFIPAIAAQLGARVVEVPVNHRKRMAGSSKYGIGRLFRVILDLITVKFLSEFSTRPSHLFGLLGILALIVGSSITGVLVIQRAVFKSPLADRPLLLLSVFMVIIGVQFVTMGLIGEMLSRVYHESQRKPIYLVREVYRGPGVTPATTADLHRPRDGQPAAPGRP